MASRATTTRIRKVGPSRNRLQSVLMKQLPAPMAEVLLPSIQWRVSKTRITAILPNQIWEDLFNDHCLNVLQGEDLDGITDIRVISRLADTGGPAHRQQVLDNFLSDPGNEFPISAGRQIIEEPGLSHNPFYIHGPSGSGKSHLLNALVAEFSSLLSNDAVVHISAEDWIAQYAQELVDRRGSELADKLEQAAVIAFDDVEQLADRSVAQEQLFHLINDALDRGQQLILAGNAAPKRLPGLEERLVSRLAWGLVVSIDAPKVETRVALLRELAGAVLDDIDGSELANLVDALAPDMHQVIQLADRFLSGEKVSVGEDKASFDRVLEVVTNHYGIRAGDIAGKRRYRRLALARQTALLLGRRLTGHSLEALGGMVGGRDHSTVLYLIRQAEDRTSNDAEFNRLITDLTQQVLN